MTFLGWEGVGLCSYLLDLVLVRAQRGGGRGQEGVRHQPRRRRRVPARDVPDLRDRTASLDYAAMSPARAARSSSGTATAIALLLLVGAIGKSAQIPLHLWLPDAMEGPTPVSALIHAATMVTAGVFLLCRAHPFLEASGDAMTVVAWVGAHHRAARRHGRARATRHQTRARVLHDQPARLHVPRRRRRRVQRRRVHGDLPRVLQGHAVPRRRLGDPRQRTTTRTCGSWAGSGSSCPYTAFACVVAWLAIAGIPPFSGLLVEGRDHRERVPRRRLRAVDRRHRSPRSFTALYMTRADLPDVLRQRALPATRRRVRRVAGRVGRLRRRRRRTARSPPPTTTTRRRRRRRRRRPCSTASRRATPRLHGHDPHESADRSW